MSESASDKTARREPRCVTSLDEFIEWTGQFKDGQYLFRGVSKGSYKIEASACRRLPTTDRNNPAKLLKINQELIEKARSLGHDQKNAQQLTDLDLLAELQHFGAATCLIDFTRSALVALWFGCQESSTGKANGRVFAVRSDDPARFKTVDTNLAREAIGDFFMENENGKFLLYQWQPKHQNNRIIAQQSVFVFGGAEIEMAAECVINESSKEEIRKSLDKLSSITEASMFLDFDGFARLHAHDRLYIEPDAQGYLQRGIEAHQKGDLDGAIDYYTEVISLDPNVPIIVWAYNNRGNAYSDKGEFARAIDDFDKAIKYRPNDAILYNNRGNAFGKKREFDCAIADYSKAIDLDPKLAEAYYNRGRAYREKDEFRRAIEDYSKAIKLYPDASAYNNRGGIYGQKGKYARAIEDFDKAIELRPNYDGAYYNRGRAYRHKNKYARAIDDFNKAIELNPDYAEAYFDRGLCWMHLQNWQKAKSDLTIARDMGMDIIEAFGNAYGNVEAFEQEYSVQLPLYIVRMVTRKQG